MVLQHNGNKEGLKKEYELWWKWLYQIPIRNNLSRSSWNDSKWPPGWQSCSLTLFPLMQTSPLFLFFLHQESPRVPFLDPFHHPWGSLTVSNQHSHFSNVSLEVLLSLTEIWLFLMRWVNPSWSSLSKEDSVCCFSKLLFEHFCHHHSMSASIWNQCAPPIIIHPCWPPTTLVCPHFSQRLDSN